jgi:hypothetical protein
MVFSLEHDIKVTKNHQNLLPTQSVLVAHTVHNLKKKTNFKIPILTSLTFERNNNHKSQCKKHPANSFPCTIEILIISQGFTEPFILFSERKTNVII